MTIEIEEKTELDISAELLSYVPDKYQKNVGYFHWDLMLALGKVFVKLWNRLRYLSRFVADITTLDYEDLVKFIYQRSGIIAKTETNAKGQIKVVSGSGLISAGSIFETPDGLQFQSIEDVTISEGESFNAECLLTGEVGNVPAGTITKIPATIQGIISITNDMPFSGGYEKESKQSLIERYYTKLRQPISSGNIYHYKSWALECTGVGKVKVKPLWNGDNTVKVIIADSNNECASNELVNTVQKYIDPYTLDNNGKKLGWGCGNGQAPIGAYCTVESAIKKEINIAVKIKLKVGETKENVTKNIQNEVKQYLKTTVFADNAYVSYAKVNSAIINAEGVEDCTDLQINNNTNNIIITENDTSCELAILNNLTIEIITEGE